MDEGRAVVSVARFVLAVVVVLAMWLIAVIALFVGLLEDTCGPDATGAECDEAFSWVALGLAASFFVASAPAGYLIAGRRWMLAAPLVPIVASVIGVVIASL